MPCHSAQYALDTSSRCALITAPRSRGEGTIMAVVTRPLRRPWMSGDVFVSTLTVLVILTAWTVATTVFHVSPFVLPSPKAMGDEMTVLLNSGYGGKPLYIHVAAS